MAPVHSRQSASRAHRFDAASSSPLPDCKLSQHAASTGTKNAHKLSGFLASRSQTQTGGWAKHLPHQERGHVGDPSGSTRETAPACRCLTLLAGPLPRSSVATTPPVGWITAEP
ncbi:hypothetical protein LA080_004942 [Diaporthe eres]|nr:hypothetical protein LA080_004942 [Diaporthe eres]